MSSSSPVPEPPRLKTWQIVAIALVVFVLYSIGIGFACYKWGKDDTPPPPAPITNTVTLPPDTVEGPGRVETVFVNPHPDSDYAEADMMEDWRIAAADANMRLQAALEENARYHVLWAELDTTRQVKIVVRNSRDSVLAQHLVDRRLQIRYGYLPVNKFILTESNAQINVNYDPPAKPAPEEPGFWANIWDAYKTGSAVVVSAEILYFLVRALVSK